MRQQISAVFTMQDINNYFTYSPDVPVDHWVLHDEFNMELQGTIGEEVEIIEVSIAKANVVYSFIIKSVDEKEEKRGFSENPIKEIKDYLGVGKYKKTFSSSDLVSVLNTIGEAFFKKGKLNASSFIATSRRVKASFDDGLRVLTAAKKSKESEIAKNVKSDEIKSLLEQVEKEKWDVKVEEEHNEEIIVVNYGDQFEIKIWVKDINYDYKFSVQGDKENLKEGTSDDPITVYQKWIDQINDAKIPTVKVKDSQQSTSAPEE